MRVIYNAYKGGRPFLRRGGGAFEPEKFENPYARITHQPRQYLVKIHVHNDMRERFNVVQCPTAECPTVLLCCTAEILQSFDELGTVFSKKFLRKEAQVFRLFLHTYANVFSCNIYNKNVSNNKCDNINE